jgi:hypothetical protein
MKDLRLEEFKRIVDGRDPTRHRWSCWGPWNSNVNLHMAWACVPWPDMFMLRQTPWRVYDDHHSVFCSMRKMALIFVVPWLFRDLLPGHPLADAFETALRGVEQPSLVGGQRDGIRSVYSWWFRSAETATGVVLSGFDERPWMR